MHYRYHDSPVGPLLLAGDEQGLHLLLMEVDNRPWRIGSDWQPARSELDMVCHQLDEYFAGSRRRFELRLALCGTAFQQQVWQALQAIPYGQTCSYSELADAIDRPRAVRAVGAANGANPISIIVPCHRVIGRNGTLTGYAGGLARKQLLLNLEGVLQPQQAALL